jgi:ribosome-associated protein
VSPEDLAQLLVSAAEAKKAWDPVILDLRGKTVIADFFVICDGDTDRQLRAIADEMIAGVREVGVRPLSANGYEDAAGWILLDFDAVLAHVFLPGEREYYDLEGLWAPSAAKRQREATGRALQ